MSQVSKGQDAYAAADDLLAQVKDILNDKNVAEMALFELAKTLLYSSSDNFSEVDITAVINAAKETAKEVMKENNMYF